MPETRNLLLSSAASALRGWTGIRIQAAVKQPERMLVLYDMENCPFCRLVREAATELDLDLLIKPCPKDSKRYRDEAEAIGGLRQFPLLVDPNTGKHLYESMDIIEYLYREYGERDLPLHRKHGNLHKATSFLSSLVRTGETRQVEPVNMPPAKPLELYSFEASPYARPVRERLSDLEIPWILRNVGRLKPGDWALPPVRKALNLSGESQQRNRKVMFEKTGKVSVPWLVDPNTGTDLFESDAILDYLAENYAG